MLRRAPAELTSAHGLEEAPHAPRRACAARPAVGQAPGARARARGPARAGWSLVDAPPRTSLSPIRSLVECRPCGSVADGTDGERTRTVISRSCKLARVGSTSQAIAPLARPRREVARPARPRRIQRSGGGPWSDARISAALRTWTDEVGRPPRSYDWSPAAAHAGGFPLASVAKWEREYPRWPHHALVRARFGSWRAALQAAGLPTAPALAMPRRERVHTAQRLQGRLSADELADVLGVTAGTVRSYWNAGTCPRCGGPKIRAEAGSCADCIPYVALRRPSSSAVVRALRRWARETGAPPRRHEWLMPGGKWEREYPRWPSAGDVDAHFDSWPQALEAAGLRPHRRSWTREAVIEALQAWAREHGRAPLETEWRRSGLEHPPAGTVKNVFGSWSAALRAAGLQPARHGAWTEAEVLAGLRAFERDHGRPPTSGDLRDTRGTPYPPASAVIRTLGSLRAALERVGHQAAWTRGGRRGDPHRAARLRAPARPRPDRDGLAARAPQARRVGDHPPSRQLERRPARRRKPLKLGLVAGAVRILRGDLGERADARHPAPAAKPRCAIAAHGPPTPPRPPATSRQRGSGEPACRRLQFVPRGEQRYSGARYSPSREGGSQRGSVSIGPNVKAVPKQCIGCHLACARTLGQRPQSALAGSDQAPDRLGLPLARPSERLAGRWARRSRVVVRHEVARFE